MVGKEEGLENTTLEIIHTFYGAYNSKDKERPEGRLWPWSVSNDFFQEFAAICLQRRSSERAVRATLD